MGLGPEELQLAHQTAKECPRREQETAKVGFGRHGPCLAKEWGHSLPSLTPSVTETAADHLRCHSEVAASAGPELHWQGDQKPFPSHHALTGPATMGRHQGPCQLVPLQEPQNIQQSPACRAHPHPPKRPLFLFRPHARLAGAS